MDFLFKEDTHKPFFFIRAHKFFLIKQNQNMPYILDARFQSCSFLKYLKGTVSF